MEAKRREREEVEVELEETPVPADGRTDGWMDGWMCVCECECGYMELTASLLADLTVSCIGCSSVERRSLTHSLIQSLAHSLTYSYNLLPLNSKSYREWLYR